MNHPAITSAEVHSMIQHGLIGFKAAYFGVSEATVKHHPKRTPEQRRERYLAYQKAYYRSHGQERKQYLERTREHRKAFRAAKRAAFIAQGLRCDGQPRASQHKPRTDLANLKRREYHRRYMRQWRKSHHSPVHTNSGDEPGATNCRCPTVDGV